MCAEMGEKRVSPASNERSCVRRLCRTTRYARSSFVLSESFFDATRGVVRFARDNPAHTAARFRYVAFVSRNQVDVEMEDGLPSRAADVDADVVTVWLIEVVDDLSGSFYRRHHGRPLIFRSLEPRRDVPIRNKKGVAPVDGECVPKPIDEGVGEKKAARIGTTEWTRRGAQDVRTVTTVTRSRPSSPS